jgi:Na+-driven multidrug efflux pump
MRPFVVRSRTSLKEALAAPSSCCRFPTILEMSMESLFGIVDVFWVASLGPDAVAAVGLTEGLLTLIFAAAMGLCMGTTAMVARRIGEKDPAGAAVAAVQSILLGLLISLPIGLGGALYAPTTFSLDGGLA